MKFDVEAVQNIISSSPRKNGSFNLFFKLNDKIGIKLSSNEKQRDSNYKNQEKAAKFGLGPEVFGKIDGVEYLGKKYYGYFTEIVYVIENLNSYDNNLIEFLYRSICEDVADLVSDLESKCDYSFTDNHIGNIGIKDGKIVCIDFDKAANCEYIQFAYQY